MSDRLLRQIAARMSLRKPQIDSLNILSDMFDCIDLRKKPEVSTALAAIKEEYPSVEDFERDFPSLCFALATGVGKTRLMGAFVTYLFQTGRSRHFFILAPNTTIYEKLIGDFSREGPKYVFRGISEFAQFPPIVETGDTWDQGRGIRYDDMLGEKAPRLFIFNVDKINKEAGRIRKLHEYIGQSFFDYLAGLPDLVLLMDEAHRYRAKAAFKALTELKPMLGLELTATPKTVGAKSVEFRNVIYRYDLASAMADGFIKEPAVATRKDFDPKSVGAPELERIKLEDGVHAHENVKLKLREYSERTAAPLVHPFMLVVAQDIEHAEALKSQIEADAFFGGRYKGRTITIHSNKTGEESDEAQAKLVAVEHDGATEIVIHVNKLKEGWDVTNLYTIVPLRASASEILTEQTLGRGLRLPYGLRTGEEAIDTLTVIAHDRFDEVIQKAKEPGSLVQKTVEIAKDGTVWTKDGYEMTSPTVIEAQIEGKGVPGLSEVPKQDPLFASVEAKTVAEVTVRVIRQIERDLSSAAELKTPKIQAQIAKRVSELTKPLQGSLEGIVTPIDVEKIVQSVTTKVADGIIEIPEIVVLPTDAISFSFRDFDLENLKTIAPQPISDDILVQQLRTDHRMTIIRTMRTAREERLEDYLIAHLIDYDEIDYDFTADLLYKLAGQMVTHLRSYLTSEEAIENVLLNNGKTLARFIYNQMLGHYEESPTTYRAKVSKGFQILEPLSFKVADGKPIRDFKAPVSPLSETRKYVFGGFKKCLYYHQTFQSDQERKFAVLIDSTHEPSVQKWVKPGRKQFQIEFRRTERYEPDFVVETKDEKYIVEIKAKDEMTDETVLAKAQAARTWIGYANLHAKRIGGKPWRYVLIPHDAILTNSTFDGLVKTYGQPEIPADPNVVFDPK